MNRIDQLFERARAEKKIAFVPFLTAGDPDLETTFRVAKTIDDVARELRVPVLIELGFPYSDPLADGPTIQTSYTRSLNRGTKVAEILSHVRAFREVSNVPLAAMVSYTIVHRRSPVEFMSAAQEAGIDGLVLPDLPVEESGPIQEWGKAHDFKLIQLVAPTTREDRLPKIAASSTGFLYYISVTGITGERRELPLDLKQRVQAIRQHAKAPLCVGFGISEPEQVGMIAEIADGVIVGSALVRRVGEIKPGGDLEPVVSFVRSLITPLCR